MAFVVVSTALAMNNTVEVVCDDLETLLQALSDAVSLVMGAGNESTAGLIFITNVTAFNDQPCVANVCPQCGGVFNLSSLLPSSSTNRRRLLSSGGVSLTTVSTSTTPVVNTNIQSAAPPPEQFQSALIASLASVAPTLVPAGIVAQVSSVLVPTATPVPFFYDNRSIQWINAGVSLGALTVLMVIVFVVVCFKLVREQAPKQQQRVVVVETDDRHPRANYPEKRTIEIPIIQKRPFFRIAHRRSPGNARNDV
jgi:hypothetical protein